MTTLSGRAIWEGEWAKPWVEGFSPRAPTPSSESPA